MTKRKGADSEETREAILAAAADEFYLYGYEKATLRRICANAGVTTGAVYCFYGNKENLLSAVMYPIFKVVSSVSIDFDRILNDDYSAFENFRRFFSANRKLYRILYTNMNNPVIAEYLDGLNEEFCNQVTELALKVTEGRQLPAELEQSSRYLANIMVYSIIKIIAEEADDDAAAKQLITIIRVFKNGIISLLK